jgi:hypothetical protein
VTQSSRYGERRPAAAAAGTLPPAIGQQIKLPSLWPEDPASWFRLAEGQFALRNVVDPITRYYHVLAALSVDSVHLVRHVLHDDTGPKSYNWLRTSLLASHSISNYQKMEWMMRLPPLGDRKPSVMLAEMLEFCPAGEATTAVFAFLFLQRLPREIRALLSEDGPADMRAIAKKADRLIAMHVPQSHESCTAVAAEDVADDSDVVAALQGARSRREKGHKRPLQPPPQQKALGHRFDISKKSQEKGMPLRTSMCYYHAKFGEQAKYCQEGCVWPEN